MLVPGRQDSRRRPERADEMVFHCRSCKKLVTIPITRLQIRRCLTAIGFLLLACALGWFLWGKMRHRSSIFVIGPVAVAMGLSLLGARLSARAFSKGRRNNRRYPLIDQDERPA